MKARHRTLMIAATIVACFSTAAGAVELPRELPGQYRSLVVRIREVYSRATISGTLKHELPQANKFCDQQFTFRAAGPNVRIDLTTQSQRGFGFVDGAKDVYMGAPYASMHSFWKPNSDVFDDANELSYQAAKARIDEAFPITKIYSIGSQGTVLDLLQSSSVKITEVKKMTAKGTPVVKISFQEGGHAPGPHGASSWVALSPSEGWALRQYHRTMSNGVSEVVYRGTLTYSGMHEGAPLLLQMETWQEQGPGKTCLAHDLIHVSSFNTEEPGHDYFAAFGLGPGRDPQ
jgi:hypothetical protein